MLAILDTNQFVSALIQTEGIQGQLLHHWDNERFELALSPQLYEELEDVLSRPYLQDEYQIKLDRVSAFLADIRERATFVEGLFEVFAVPNDPDDNMVLACALEAKADFIVTGDRHLLNLKKFHRIRIVRATEFLQILASEERPTEQEGRRD